VHVAGDHDVVIGRVIGLDVPGHEREPMIFFRGKLGLGADEPPVVMPEPWGWGDHWG
jgi:3-hydroxy-9,10-secoandrosta-1,3,5(10)-triene-9,17-dione monooxygenase reductase component